MRKRVRYAVVGLGHFAQTAILPAFHGARRNSEVTALISGDDEKRRQLQAAYRVPVVGDYEAFGALARSEQFDAVYIATPNAQHAALAVTAAKAGLHVLIEKPLAPSVKDCRRIIDACARARVKLMCAYRLHFEASTLAANELARSGKLGAPKLFSATFTQMVPGSNSRWVPDEAGGGPLFDVGVYCLNAARNLFGAEPVEVFAMLTPEHLGRDRVEEQAAVVLRFPDERLATFAVSFVAAHDSHYELIGEKGLILANPAFSHAGVLAHDVRIGERTRHREFASRDQLAAELMHFSDCVLADHQPEPSGDEALRDVRVIEALLKSAKTRKPVRLPALRARHPPGREREVFVPPSNRRPPKVSVAAPRK